MPKSIRTRVLAASGIAAFAFAVTACGPTGTDAQDNTPSSQPSSQQPAAQQSSQPASGSALVAAKSPSFDAYVTDGQGRTLYRFDKDTAHPSVSNCAGDCAVKWPAATAGDSVSLRGIDKSLVSTITRADGSKQLTLAGWPLYRFAKDTKPGDTKGQGVGGTWFVSSPQGRKAQEKAASADPNSVGNYSGSGAGSGY
ncbi:MULTISPECIES: hypothetical protein [unclassified Streptomyces]|uniref:hypothetical protein n=1 Tax=unclassified Streptomyces TaxID=2593676 RepID=UPI0032D5796C